MSQLFTSGGQSIGASASASVIPMTNNPTSHLSFVSLAPFSPLALPFFLTLQDAPSLSCIFPAQTLESNISPYCNILQTP